MSERVQFSLRGRIGVITMCDAEHFNALSPPQVRAMLDALKESKAARALVIASSAKHFCAGADIKEFLKGELLDPNRPAPATSPVNLFRALIDDPRPVIAAVDGLAMGGGVELTVSCDLVLASEKARFALPELGLGLIPRTALARLPEIVGRRKALELILTRRRLTADEAVALGLANQRLESAGLLEAAVKLAEEIVTAAGRHRCGETQPGARAAGGLGGGPCTARAPGPRRMARGPDRLLREADAGFRTFLEAGGINTGLFSLHPNGHHLPSNFGRSSMKTSFALLAAAFAVSCAQVATQAPAQAQGAEVTLTRLDCGNGFNDQRRFSDTFAYTDAEGAVHVQLLCDQARRRLHGLGYRLPARLQFPTRRR